MIPLSRRTFLGWLAATLPAAAFVRSAHAAAVADLAADPRTLRALAETVLPAELGRAGIDTQVTDFQKWIAGYRDGAELLHGYGTSALERARPTPATRWMQQLDHLDAAAHKQHSRAFADASLAQRRGLVEAALTSHSRTSLPSLTSAPHIEIGRASCRERV